MNEIPFSLMWVLGVVGAWAGMLLFRILKKRK